MQTKPPSATHAASSNFSVRLMSGNSMHHDNRPQTRDSGATAGSLQHPVFIAGAGRSGTTLLRSLLSAHPRICVTPETHYMARAEKWGFRDRDTPLDFDRFWSRYTASVRFRDLGVDPDYCRGLVESAGPPTFRRIFEAVLTAYGQRMAKPRIGEKTPGHVHYIPELLSWFPDARILILRRDPRAVVASQMRSPWVKERLTPTSLRSGLVVGSHTHQVALYADNWATIYEQVVPAASADPRVRVVEYESLVQDTERELRQICDFLDEAFEPAMLDSRSDDNVPIPASTSNLDDAQWQAWRENHHAATLQPVFTSSLEKWRDQLTGREIAMVEGRCAAGMARAGYEPSLPASRRASGRRAARTLLLLEGAEAGVRSRPVQAWTGARKKLRRGLRRRVPRIGVQLGLPPSWFGYRWLERTTVPEYLDRGRSADGVRCEVVHDDTVVDNPLPCNIASRRQLPGDKGWWGFAFSDVPARSAGATRIITLPECRVAWYRDPEHDDDFHPAILTRDQRGLDLREIRFRHQHAEFLRRAGPPAHVERATWILERVYHNHAHWLTAHLPKILLLRERGGLGDVLLPPVRTPTMDGSLRMLGIDPDGFRTFDPTRPLEVGELTLVQTDRFRPELLQRVQAAFAATDGGPRRKVYVSRANAGRRKLVNEEEAWPRLRDAGFERVAMEELGFDEQVELMRETRVLAGPHGAGLTNMLFCPPGAHIVELADLSFPNPNFYALACGLGHHYWILGGEPAGHGHPLARNFRIDIASLDALLEQLSDVAPRPLPANAPQPSMDARLP